MNKDALLATIIGFGVGLIIAGLVFFGPTFIKSVPNLTLPNLSFLTNLWKKSERVKPTPTSKPNEVLSIQSPLPESIESKQETLISGKTAPKSILVIEGENSEVVSVANDEGVYAGKIMLEEGKNDIIVTSYTNDKIQTLSIRVYYTPEDF